ncbi:MAG: phosphoglycerate kinase, partial [Atribacterota bacterium]|nr:phosphoglycerate kinase [Atribacterota bacterium]
MPNTKASIYLRDIEKEILINKKVIVRVDYNVPLDKKLAVTDDSRILATLETIKYLLSAGCKVILMSHLGRPNGESNNKLKLDPVARKLEDLLQKKVIKLDDCIGQDVKKFISDSNNGELILLENLRFYKEEEENDEYFAKELASLADIYINDAFGAAHRAHASTVGITSFVPSYIGFLMEKEIKTLDKLIKNPDRPFVSVIGGAKVRDKITILEKLVDISDILLIGGGMAYTFLAALGYEVGRSILEKEYIENVKKILGIAKKKNKEIVIPVDSLVADEFAEDAIAYNV